jgi:autotransporter-associated beta strand protein
MLAPPLLAQYTAGSPMMLGGSNDSGTVATSISGTSTVTKSGTGVFTLTGSNTYSGSTTISGGTLRAGGTQSFGTGSVVNLANTSGAQLDLNSYSSTVGGLVGGGTLGGNVVLGNGTLTMLTSALGAREWVSVISNGDQNLFLKSDGSVWACGANGYGQLGDGTTIDKAIPVQIMNGVSAIGGGYYHSFFLKSDGSVWACGRARRSGGLRASDPELAVARFPAMRSPPRMGRQRQHAVF